MIRCLPVGLSALIVFLSVGTSHGEDRLRTLQAEAYATKVAPWAHWGPDATKYSSWTSHTSRLIPLYSFGMDLSSVTGANSAYRDEQRLKQLYGCVPEQTLNPQADYCDQTDVYRLQEMAIAAGKKCVVLVVFDGMDWHTTRAAAIYRSGKIYEEGRGEGLHFLDYRGTTTDYGYFVSAPHSAGTKLDVNTQSVKELGTIPGGFCPQLGGDRPWAKATDANYWIGKGEIKHAYPDSSATATAMTTGVKTYNEAVNIDPFGRQLTPISHKLQAEGFAVGVVTSVPISHATPACAYAHNVDRDDYQDLTRDLLGLPSIAHPVMPLPGVDVLIGAGFGQSQEKDELQGKNYVPGNRYVTAADLEACNGEHGGKYEVALRTKGRAGSVVLEEAAKNAIANDRRLFGYFGGPKGHLPFQTANGDYHFVPPLPDPAVKDPPAPEKYTSADLRENPTLAQMAEAALEVLSKRSDRFWLMLEAGDVDWANHQNNLDASIGAVMSGDDAFRTVTAWIEKNVGWDNAVVLVTADHGHYLVLDDPSVLLDGKK